MKFAQGPRRGSLPRPQCQMAALTTLSAGQKPWWGAWGRPRGGRGSGAHSNFLVRTRSPRALRLRRPRRKFRVETVIYRLDTKTPCQQEGDFT